MLAEFVKSFFLCSNLLIFPLRVRRDVGPTVEPFLPATMSDVLPIELIENIIGFLHNDKEQLSICSRVCKKWLPSSQRHLFSEVFILATNHRQFVSRLGKPMLGAYSLKHLIKHVHVYTSADRSARSGSSSAHRAVRFDLIMLTPLLCLSALTSIRLSYTKLRKVDILQFLSSFPLLEEIFMDGNVWGPSQELRLSDIKRYDVPRALRVIDLWWCTIPPIVDWIHSRSEYTPPVQVLSLRAIDDSELQATGNCIRALGSSLLELVLDFCNYNNILSERYISHIDLAHNTELRSITIFNLITGSARSWVAAIPHILSSVSSPHIHTIALILSAKVSNVFEALDCRLLETILERPQFRGLRNMRIDILKWEADGVEDWIRESLPECEARGILQIQRE